jgi:hypothetical protein
MKSRQQLHLALARAYHKCDDLRLCIGLGDDTEDQYEALDLILDRIDRLTTAIADHDARQAQWRANHITGILKYRQTHHRTLKLAI